MFIVCNFCHLAMNMGEKSFIWYINDRVSLIWDKSSSQQQYSKQSFNQLFWYQYLIQQYFQKIFNQFFTLHFERIRLISQYYFNQYYFNQYYFNQHCYILWFSNRMNQQQTTFQISVSSIFWVICDMVVLSINYHRYHFINRVKFFDFINQLQSTQF